MTNRLGGIIRLEAADHGEGRQRVARVPAGLYGLPDVQLTAMPDLDRLGTAHPTAVSGREESTTGDAASPWWTKTIAVVRSQARNPTKRVRQGF